MGPLFGRFRRTDTDGRGVGVWGVGSGFELRFLRRDKCVIVDATFAAARHHVAVIAWVASGFCLLFGNGY